MKNLLTVEIPVPTFNRAVQSTRSAVDRPRPVHGAVVANGGEHAVDAAESVIDRTVSSDPGTFLRRAVQASGE